MLVLTGVDGEHTSDDACQSSLASDLTLSHLSGPEDITFLCTHSKCCPNTQHVTRKIKACRHTH